MSTHTRCTNPRATFRLSLVSIALALAASLAPSDLRAQGAAGGRREVVQKTYAWPAVPAGATLHEDRIEVTAESGGVFEFVVSGDAQARPYLRVFWKGAGRTDWKAESTTGLAQRKWPVQAGDAMAIHVTRFGGREMTFKVSVLFSPAEAAPAEGWFKSRNIRASGTPHPRIREHLLQLQEYYTLIGGQLRTRAFDLAKRNIEHLQARSAASGRTSPRFGPRTPGSPAPSPSPACPPTTSSPTSGHSGRSRTSGSRWATSRGATRWRSRACWPARRTCSPPTS